MTIAASVFDRVLGGRAPPTQDGIPTFYGDPMPLRAAMLQELYRLGYANRTDEGVRAKRGALFKVTFPPASPDSNECETDTISTDWPAAATASAHVLASALEERAARLH